MRGQSTAEFYFVLAALLIIFMIFLVIERGQSINLYHSQELLSASNRAYSLAAAINYVYLAGEGTTYNFTFQKFSNENVTINNGIVECKKGKTIAQAKLLTDWVNASNISAGEMLIKNNNGVVQIEQ